MPTWGDYGPDGIPPAEWLYRRVDPGPGEPEMIFLPTKPATQIEWSAAPWPLCWVCRVLGILRARKARDHHMDKRHPGLADYLPEDT